MLAITLKDVLKALILKDESTIRSIRDLPTGTIYLRLAEIVKPFLDIFGRGYENLHSAPLPYNLYSCCHIYFMIDGVPMWFEARHTEKDNEIVWVIEYVVKSNGTDLSKSICHTVHRSRQKTSTKSLCSWSSLASCRMTSYKITPF